MKSKVFKEIGTNLYAVVAILFIWKVLNIYVGDNMVPSLSQTFSTFLDMLNTDFYLHIVYSFYRITASITVSMAVGIPIGIILGLNKRIREILSPIIYLLYPIPKIAFLPIFMVLFGIGDKSKILLMITIIVFQIIISIRDAVLEIDESIMISTKLMNFNKIDLCYHVVLPVIAPKLFSSLRVSIGICISALFFSENYATKYGIGYFIMNSWSMVSYKEMFVGVIMLSIMALIIYKFIDLLEKVLCPWNK